MADTFFLVLCAQQISSHHICVCLNRVIQQIPLRRWWFSIGAAVQLDEGLAAIVAGIVAIWRSNKKDLEWDHLS